MISIDDIRKCADTLGIEGMEHMARTELIRSIQTKEGYSPCYGAAWCKPEWKETCMWKDICDAKNYFPDVGG